MGKKACGKTYFLQKLGPNKFFGKLVKTEWVTGIEIGEQRETEIQSCFSKKVEFHLVTEPNDPVSLIEKFKLRIRDITNKFQWIILLLWTTSQVLLTIVRKIIESLTVCRKYRYYCIYVFNITMPENQIWKKILSQTNIFNIFSSSVPYNTVAKILQSNSRQTAKKMFLLIQCGSIGFLVTLPTQMNDILNN